MDRLLIQLVGGAIVLIALADIFLTVLHPRARAGVFSPWLNRAVWLTIREGSRLWRGRRREVLRGYAGPIALTLTVTAWLLLIILGFGLIAWTELGRSVLSPRGATPTDLLTALYYSGSALSTVGLGDFVPQTTGSRLIFLVESILGLSLVTLAITYFLSIYTALNRRNAFASELHYMTARTGDAAELLVGIGTRGMFDAGARGELAQMSRELLALLQTHHAYPVVHLFHQEDGDISPARVGLVALDTVSLVRSALDREANADFVDAAAIEMLWDGGLKLLMETGHDILTPADRDAVDHPRAGEWRVRYLAARDRLAGAGYAVERDVEAGAAAYARQRRRWDGLLRALAAYHGQDWPDVDRHARGTAVSGQGPEAR